MRGRALKDVLVDRAVAKSPKGVQPLPEVAGRWHSPWWIRTVEITIGFNMV